MKHDNGVKFWAEIYISCICVMICTCTACNVKDESTEMTETVKTEEILLDSAEEDVIVSGYKQIPAQENNTAFLTGILAKLEVLPEEKESKYKGTYEELIEDPEAWNKCFYDMEKEPTETWEEHRARFWNVEVKIPEADEEQLGEINEKTAESYEKIKEYGFWTSDDVIGGLEDWIQWTREEAEKCEEVNRLYDIQHISNLHFALLPGTLLDCGDYYAVEALFMEDAYVPDNLQIGDTYTFVINELTQENMTLTCCEAPDHSYYDEVLVSDKGLEYGYRMHGGNARTYLEDNANNEQRTVGKGMLRLRKDVIIGEVIVYQYRSFKPTRELIDRSASWFDETVFDEEGYVTWLNYTGS